MSFLWWLICLGFVRVPATYFGGAFVIGGAFAFVNSAIFDLAISLPLAFLVLCLLMQSEHETVRYVRSFVFEKIRCLNNAKLDSVSNAVDRLCNDRRLIEIFAFRSGEDSRAMEARKQEAFNNTYLATLALFLWLPLKISILSLWRFSFLLSLSCVCALADIVIVHDLQPLQRLISSLWAPHSSVWHTVQCVLSHGNARVTAQIGCEIVLLLSPFSLLGVLYFAAVSFFTSTALVGVIAAAAVALLCLGTRDAWRERRSLALTVLAFAVFDLAPLQGKVLAVLLVIAASAVHAHSKLGTHGVVALGSVFALLLVRVVIRTLDDLPFNELGMALDAYDGFVARVLARARTVSMLWMHAWCDIH
jgi:hypothetical protein